MVERDVVSPQERWERVAVLLFRAACRASPQTISVPRTVLPSLTLDQLRVLEAIQDTQMIRPEQIRLVTKLSRTTLTRSLRVLLRLGLVERTGRTHQAAYRATTAANKKN